jgi:hypothetical protein
MRRVNPSIWILTETSAKFSPGPKFELIARTIDAPDRNSQKGECWTAIWSRVPAERVEVKVDRQRMVAVRTSIPPQGEILVIGTVLPWLNDGQNPPVGAESFCRVLCDQSVEWRRLKEDKPYAGWCVAGDFNQDLSASHFYGSNIGREALKRVRTDLELTCLTGGADDPLDGFDGRWSIDHICIGGSLRPSGTVKSCAWPKLPFNDFKNILTDHYGVCSDLILG